jgi:aspartyl-tRNA(Asn)/glutamyl-tRNA(Gln) amidotransferase subunit A
VPMYPSSPFGTLAHVGPLTRDAADAALVLDVITGEDWRDWSHLGPSSSVAAGLAEGVKGLRIAYSPRRYGGPWARSRTPGRTSRRPTPT